MKAILLLALLATTVASDQRSNAPIPVYVGPQTRDGFVDANRGVRDSIRDTQNELKKKKHLKVVARPEDATLHIYIIRRYLGGNAGAVAIPLATGGVIAAPIDGHVVEALLKFGEYEKTFLAEERDYGNWRACAVFLARDVETWVNENRAKLDQQ